jgi:RimJ/RimL family protein N-acetyltransferase
VIRTERLLLRRWRPSDREPFAAMNADPEVTAYLQGVRTGEQSDAFVDRIERHWGEHGWGLWAVEVPGESPFIGYVGLWPADVVAAGAVEVGWRLARASWGRGYATEAAREALRHGFTEVGLAEIVSFTVLQNERSWRVMERIGLVRHPAGDFDHPHVDPVAYPHLVRHVLYRLDRDTWRRSLFPK